MADEAEGLILHRLFETSDILSPYEGMSLPNYLPPMKVKILSNPQAYNKVDEPDKAMTHILTTRASWSTDKNLRAHRAIIKK